LDFGCFLEVFSKANIKSCRIYNILKLLSKAGLYKSQQRQNSPSRNKPGVEVRLRNQIVFSQSHTVVEHEPPDVYHNCVRNFHEVENEEIQHLGLEYAFTDVSAHFGAGLFATVIGFHHKQKTVETYEGVCKGYWHPIIIPRFQHHIKS